MPWKAPICGPIDVPSGWTETEDGPAPTGLRPGYHLNVPVELVAAMPELEPFTVAPANPVQVFAGLDRDESLAITGFLRFADEAEARGVLGEFWDDPAEPDA